MSTILVADDEKTVRSLLRDVLEIEGYHVVEAADGPEALYRLHCGGIDLILLDVMMPGMSGMEVSQSLSADPALANIPVIMLSALGNDADIEAGMKAGARAYLVKPFSPWELLDKVAQLIDEARV